MKKLVAVLSVSALIIGGCSKEEIVEETIPSDGVSTVATNSNGVKNTNTDGPEIWFQENQGRMMMRLSGPIGTLPTDCRPTGRINFRDASDVIAEPAAQGSLCRLGNSRNYRTESNTFNFSEEDYFSLVDFRVDWNSADDTPQEVSGSLFLYPSGRTVAQDPQPVKGLIGGWTFDDGAAQDQSRALTITIADDPTQEVASVQFKSEDGSSSLEQTHFNQALGLSRWSGPGRGGSGASGRFEGDVYLLSSNPYDVDFIGGETNAQIIGKYSVDGESNGPAAIAEIDEPEFLGAALRSKSGDFWTYQIAIADLGEWVESAKLTFPEQEGVYPTQNEFDMKLVRTEANLKVFEVNGIRFEGLEDGTEVQAAVTGFGKGTRNTTFSVASKPELL